MIPSELELWFEPYKYRSDTKLYGPYAFKDSGKVVYTEDYMKEEYISRIRIGIKQGEIPK